MKGFKKVTHCIFDMDGLLLNTEQIYTTITQKILDTYGNGQRYSLEFKVTLMGLQSLDVAERIVEKYNLPLTPEGYVTLQRTYANELMPVAELLPGVERLLRHLHTENIPIALATSSSKEMFDLKTKQHMHLFDLFLHRVYGTSDPEVVNGKPAPDIFLIAAKRFNDSPAPENCLVFEDAPNGVQAAKSAGMQVVMVPEAYVNDEKRKEATIVHESLEHFKPEQFGLPPFKN